MFCKIVQKIGLFLFWNCLDEETRDKTIKEHRYTKMNINHIDNIVKKAENYEEAYLSLAKKVIELNDKANTIQDIKQLKKELSSLAEEFKANV